MTWKLYSGTADDLLADLLGLPLREVPMSTPQRIIRIPYTEPRIYGGKSRLGGRFDCLRSPVCAYTPDTPQTEFLEPPHHRPHLAYGTPVTTAAAVAPPAPFVNCVPPPSRTIWLGGDYLG